MQYFVAHNLWKLYLGNIGSYVDKLADIKKFVEKYAQESLDYSDCISTVQKNTRMIREESKKT